ncbi:thioester domain-containing protein [Bacillus thuringiensis]|uniref:thioester domain-containing protein n=1 Tax=Bacillus thuringiensis TaxID=1428 RepID=UPI000B419198|nr:thioester domain-containing protein [Bacillus thuringiensis]ARX70212.1 hypothetical protein BVH75_30250 [Bacillus thuringiensis]MEB9696925.1 thioester domain-containing protein [Bacillus cereus]
MKKVIGISCIVIVLVSMLMGNITKISAELIRNEAYQMNWSYSFSKKQDIQATLSKMPSDELMYSIVPQGFSLDTNNLSKVKKTTPILLEGYPQKKPEELGVSTWEEAHYATRATRF